MKCRTRTSVITGALYFGLVFSLSAYAQGADDPQQMEVDVEREEGRALSQVGHDLGDLANNAEKAMKNELQKDVALVEGGTSATAAPATPAAPTPSDSLKEIEREIDSLDAQSGKGHQ